MATSVTLKAVGLNYSPNQLDLPEGSLIEAKNVIIRRDSVIESRRGFKLYGDEFPEITDRAKQLFTYKNRILRHYASTLQFDDGTGTFSDFSGSIFETEDGLRIKAIEASGNFYFTTSDGIKKISASDASQLSTASGYITDAGGIKAIDFQARVKTDLGNDSDFLPQDSTVAYRILWNKKDANNLLVPGTPSQRYELYNSLLTLLLKDYNNLLGALDDINQTGSLITDGNYFSSLNLPVSSLASSLRTNLLSLTTKIDNDILYANDTGTGAPLNIDAASCSITAGVATITFSSGTATNYFIPGSKIYLSGFTPVSGTLDGAQVVGTVTATTITFTTSAGNGAITVSGSATIVSNEYRSITQPTVVDDPATDDELVSMQDYIAAIITRLQSEPVNVISSSLKTAYINELAVTKASRVILDINIPSTVTLNDFFQIYRSDISQAVGTTILSDLTPNDEMKLVYEAYPTQAQLDAKLITVEDNTPDIFRGANLYTNEATGEGILQANEVPPFAKDVNRFKNSVFFANTRTRHKKLLSLLGISNLTNGDTFVISDGNISHTYTFVSGQKEEWDIDFTGQTATALNGNYFYLNSANNNNKYYVWFEDSDNSPAADPAPVADRTGIKVVLKDADTATQIAEKTRDTIGRVVSDFLTSNSTTTLTIQNVEQGYTDDPTAETSGLSFSLVTDGKGEKAQQETAEFTTVADVAGSLAGTYFTFNTAFNHKQYYIWFKVSNTGTDPLVANKTGIQVDLATNDTASTVAQKIADSLNLNYPTGFVASNVGSTLTIKSYYFGPANNATAGTSGFTLNSVLDGALEVLLSTSISPGVAVDETAKSIVSIINKNSNDIVNGFYLSTASSTPGKFLLEAKDLSTGTFYTLGQDSLVGASFSPDISPSIGISTISAANPTVVTTSSNHGLETGDIVVISNSNSVPLVDGAYEITYISSTQFSINVNVTTSGSTGNLILGSDSQFSENEEKINRIYYSKTLQPESVPLVNYFDVGAADKAILRIFPLRDSLFVFKEDGLYRISGENPPFVLALFDSSCILVAPDSVAVANNLIYCWTTQGIQNVSENGVTTISRPIDTRVLEISSSNYTNFKTATWGVGYESDNSYLVWTVANIDDTVAQFAFRFSNLTNTWTTYEKSNTCGIVNNFDDKLYLGAGDTNYIEQERKSFSRYDYADREVVLDLTANNYFGTLMKFNSVSDVAIGDVLYQTQTITVYEYNQLLKKLDTDTGVADNNYFSTLEMLPGENIRNKIVDLANKLDSDTGVSDTDYFSSIAHKTGTITAIEISGTNAKITTSSAHGLLTGRRVSIAGSDSSPLIDDNYTVTVLNSTQFTIPVNILIEGTAGTFDTLDFDFADIKVCYNKIISKLNFDVGVNFSNYTPADVDTIFEAVIIDVNIGKRELTVNLELDFIVGDMTVFKSIESSFTYSPITMGDPVGFKHLMESTLMFNNKAFTGATLSFATDLLPQFVDVPFDGNGNGIFGMGTGKFGNNFFGGSSHSAPFRTYIPQSCQRCRYLLAKFTHKTARERYAVYGLTVTGRIGLSSRAYR